MHMKPSSLGGRSWLRVGIAVALVAAAVVGSVHPAAAGGVDAADTIDTPSALDTVEAHAMAAVTSTLEAALDGIALAILPRENRDVELD